MHTDLQAYRNGPPPFGYGDAASERDPIVDFGLRWWWLLAIGVILGVAGAVAYGKLGPASYSSTALIQVSANTGTDPTDKAGQARSAAANFAAEGKSTRMYGLVSDALSGTVDVSGSELADMSRAGNLSVGQQRGTNFIQITVIDADPDRARAIADGFAEVMVSDVNERNGVQAEARSQELQFQIDFTRQQLAAAELFDRERELQNGLQDQQQLLLTLQASYQQEQARQLEFEQLMAQQAVEPDIQGARADFERILSEQITTTEQRIEAISEELTEVRSLIAELPPDTDPLVSTAYASAYASQLSNLTEQYVQQQVSSLSAGPPLTKYGEASAAVSTQGLKKLGVMGIALGGALAAGLGFFLDYWRKKRERARLSNEVGQDPLDLAALLEAIELNNATKPTRTAQIDPEDREFSSPVANKRHG